MRLTLALLILAAANALAQSTATLSIDASHPTAKVSPTLYGIMSEEINHSYDGGLYAELIANRTFQNNRRRSLERWILLEKGSSAAAISLDTTTGPSAALPNSLNSTDTSAEVGPSRGRQPRLWGSPSIPPPPTPLPFTRAPILPASAPSPSASSTTKPAPSPPPPSSPPSAIPGVPLFTLKTGPRSPALRQQPHRITGRAPRRRLVLAPLALSAHLARPPQWYPSRPDGKAGGDASGVFPLSRRQLP